jgi:hypothetical protein
MYKNADEQVKFFNSADFQFLSVSVPFFVNFSRIPASQLLKFFNFTTL